MTKTFQGSQPEDVRIWVAAFTAPNAEIAVRDALQKRDYPVMLPTMMAEMRHARRTMMVDRPVFPRYVFVGIPHGRSWYPLKAITGVGGVLSQHGAPQPLHAKAVDLLRKAIEADAFKVRDEPPFKSGDRVFVTVGQAEIEAFVERVSHTLPAQRIDIMFRLFGKEVRQTVPVDTVRAA